MSPDTVDTYCFHFAPSLRFEVMVFSDSDIHRYARHMLLPHIGVKGQQRLSTARVLVIGAGGLGAPVLLYLAAAGVGTIGVVDHDVVDLSNIQRQVIYTMQHIGMKKRTVSQQV